MSAMYLFRSENDNENADKTIFPSTVTQAQSQTQSCSVLPPLLSLKDTEGARNKSHLVCPYRLFARMTPPNWLSPDYTPLLQVMQRRRVKCKALPIVITFDIVMKSAPRKTPVTPSTRNNAAAKGLCLWDAHAASNGTATADTVVCLHRRA